MKFRQFRVIATGQWVDALLTAGGTGSHANTFTVSPETHGDEIAAALELPPYALEVLDADSDIRVGPMLALPPPPQLQPSAEETGRSRIAELLAISRSDWTVAQYRELLQLVAQSAVGGQ